MIEAESVQLLFLVFLLQEYREVAGGCSFYRGEFEEKCESE